MVAMLLFYALPGFLLVKLRLVKQEHIPSFAKLLLYVCQPALTLYSFSKVEYSPELLVNIGIFFLISLVGQLGLLLLFYLILRKKSRENVKYRILNISLVLSNCGFFGVPVAEVLFPEMQEAAMYCMVFSLGLNLICWTAVMAIVTADKKYIRPKQIFLNPSTVSFMAALLLMVFSVRLPDVLSDGINIIGRFATPLCMLILGMRLALAKWKTVFCGLSQYLAVLIKQVLVPAFMLLCVMFLPIDMEMKKLSFVLFACPVASNVLNFAELAGEGQEYAASNVLLATVLSIVTMPLMMLLISF